LDLVLLLSSTGYGDKQKELAKKLVQRYVVSPNDTNVAIVTYDNPSITLQLKDGKNPQQILKTLDTMTIRERDNVNDVLDYLLGTVYTSKKGSRSGVPKQAIFILDDVNFKDSFRVNDQVEKLKNLGINVIFVIVGDNTNAVPTNDPFGNVYFFPDDLGSIDRIIDPVIYDTGKGSFYINLFQRNTQLSERKKIL